jgi:diguanylate cyclase (GGDEF)-like protein
MPKTLIERLAALTQEYINQLSDRVAELELAYQSFCESPDSRESAANLRLIAHKIAGSGATFGFEDITEAGRDLERAASDVLDCGLPPSEERLRSIHARYEKLKSTSIAESQAAGAVLNGDEPEADAPRADKVDIRTMALVYPSESKAIEELRDQLKLFGYQVMDITTAEKFLTFAQKNKSGIALIHTDFLFSCAGGSESIRATQQTLEHAFHYIMVSERSDFQARISALRAGGEAYFVLPLDTTRLLDTVESISGRYVSEPYHILIVDDDPEQVSYYALILQQAGMITSVASEPRTVLDILSDAKPELILMDMYMPGCTGPELLSLIRQQEAFVGIPIVFLSVEGDAEKQIQAIRRGGDGFVTKPADPEYLVTLVESHLSRTRSIRYFMERDSLTGLLNHTHLRDQLAREILRSERTESPVCFAMLDLDHFKIVNDTHGHLFGDRVLKSLSRLLQERLRRTDIIGRYGGEEFGVVLLNVDVPAAVEILDEIRANFEKVHQQAKDETFHVTFSCGVAGFPEYADKDSITHAADTALYLAKNEGRNRVISASPQST